MELKFRSAVRILSNLIISLSVHPKRRANEAGQATRGRRRGMRNWQDGLDSAVYVEAISTHCRTARIVIQQLRRQEGHLHVAGAGLPVIQ